MRTISKRSIYLMMSVFFFSTLMGCNPSETKENLVDPSPTEDNPINKTSPSPSPSPSPSQPHATRTPDLYRPDTVRETLAAEATQVAAQLTHTALPTATPLPMETPIPAGSFRLPPECEPFPDEVNIVNDDLWVRCGTEYPTLPWRLTSPAFFEDYTTRTGRLAYVDENRALWVYDFNTDSNQLWLGEEVIMAHWSPLSSSASGSQPLAILQADGELSLITGPSQISKIAIIGNASHLSWSPNGESIAYIKDRVLYTVDSYGGQPRKIAEDVSGTPVWALEDQAIIVSATPFRIVKLDGSGTFTPTKPDGTLHSNRPAGTMVWWPDRRLLIYSDRPKEMDVTGRIWILELSDDLNTVIWHIFQNGENWRIDGWWIPGESVIGWGGIFNVIPGPEEYMLEVEVEDLSLADYTIFAGWEWIYMQDDTQLLDRDGRQLSVTNLEQVSSTTLKVTCRPILQGCLANRIQILDE